MQSRWLRARGLYSICCSHHAVAFTSEAFDDETQSWHFEDASSSDDLDRHGEHLCTFLVDFALVKVFNFCI